MTTTTDPGPVPERELEDRTPSMRERLGTLYRVVRAATDQAGHANLDSPSGLLELASATVQLGRALAEITSVVRNITAPATPPAAPVTPAGWVTAGELRAQLDGQPDHRPIMLTVDVHGLGERAAWLTSVQPDDGANVLDLGGHR